jgi:hypothetical protein
MQRYFGHDQNPTEDPDQGPKGNHEVAEGSWCFVPSVSQEVGDGTRQPSPWRMWNQRVQVPVNVHMPAREVDVP